MIRKITEKRLFVFTDISHIENTNKSIIGLCIKKNKNSNEVIYITHSVIQSMSTNDMEFFAIFWALQFIDKEQKAGNLCEGLTILFLSDNKMIVDSINTEKFKKNNRNIVTNFNAYLERLKINNTINFEWIERNKNTTIDHYIQTKKTQYLSRINNETYYINDNLQKLFKEILDNLANTVFETIRIQLLLKLIKISNENIVIAENKSLKIEMNILNYHLKIVNKISGNVVNNEFIIFFGNIIDIIEDYHKKVDCIVFSIATSEL
ncbi:MAG: RNase H family protein [Methanogenium sp.]|jgi:ribonuclease HI